MTSRVAAPSRNWPAYTLTFVSGVALAKLAPVMSSIDATGPAGAISRILAGARADHLLGFSAASILLVVGMAGLMAFAASSSVRNACVAGWSSVFGAGATADEASAGLAKKDIKRRDAVHDGLEKQLNLLLKVMSSYLDASSTQSEALAEIRGKLEAAESVEQVQAIVELLAKNSADSQQDAEALRTSLHEAQKQTVALRQKLIKAEKLAALDPLTSLPNRRTFQEFLETAVAESHSDYTPLTVIMADIDHFKRVNDKFGHATGDAVIRQFAKILSGSLRSTDMVARYGGEEFVVVLKKTPVGNAVSVVERIQTNIRAAAWLEPNAGPDIGGLTASFGVAEILDNETSARLIERADQRLYAAKRAGRNRAVWTSDKAT